MPRRRVEPTEGMPRFTGGAVGALSYDAVSTSSRRCRCPEADPVGAPTAAFIETDLVLVFDHLTHTLSAIASLHTEAPDLEGRYRIAETAIFEALERTARPSAAEMGARRATRRRRGRGRPRGRIESSLGRDEYERRRRGREGRDRGRRGDPGRARAAPVVRPPAESRPAAPLDGIGLYRALRRVNPSPYLFFVRVPAFEVVGACPELLLQVEGDR